MRTRQGFTLMELLVVISIIMILTAAAAPALSAFREGQKLEHAGKTIGAVLDAARRSAITLRARHVVVFYEYEEVAGDLNTVRDAVRIYQEPTGVKPGPGAMLQGKKSSYWPGGYKNEPLVLPSRIRLKQDSMDAKLLLGGLPDEKSDVFKRHLKGEKSETIAFRPDGTIEERKVQRPQDPNAQNIFLPDEGFYQVPDGTRADVVIVQTDSTGKEMRKSGKARRCYMQLNDATGRSISRVFDIGQGFEHLDTSGKTGVGGME